MITPFFNKGWIDAGVKPGKAPGAFAHPTVTDVHPYIMLNYLGKPRDVMTCARTRSWYPSSSGIFAGTDAVFQHPLLSPKRLLSLARCLRFKKCLIKQQIRLSEGSFGNKVEDMINTVVRQIAFYDFECKLHDARKRGELTPSDINSLWMSVQSRKSRSSI